MNTTDIRVLKNAGKELNDCSYRFINCCYIAGDGEDNEIIIKKRKRLGNMKPEDGHKYLSIINSSLTGTLNEKFFPLPVEEAARELLGSILQNPEDDSALEELYRLFADNLPFVNSTNYLIVVADNTIDLKACDDNGVPIDDASEECFSYIVVSVCPVNPSKPGLSFHEDDKDFLSRLIDWVAKDPLMAVTYPAFTKGEGEPGSALLYVRNAKKAPSDVVMEIFGCECPEPASSVTGKMQTIYQNATDTGLGIEMNDEIAGIFDSEVKTMKKSIKAENDTFDGEDLERILTKAGAASDAIKSAKAAFNEEFSEGFIPTAKIMPIRNKRVKFEIHTEAPELVKTETVNGVLYMMIPVSGGVSLNGEIVDAQNEGSGAKEEESEAVFPETGAKEPETVADESEAFPDTDPEAEEPTEGGPFS